MFVKKASNTVVDNHTFVSVSQSRGVFTNPGFWGLFYWIDHRLIHTQNKKVQKQSGILIKYIKIDVLQVLCNVCQMLSKF